MMAEKTAKKCIQLFDLSNYSDSLPTEAKERYLSKHASYARMIGQMAQCKFAATKALRCCKINTAEDYHYHDLYNQIAEGIVSAQKDIEATKKELQEARQIRRNKMESDALAVIIQTQRDRKSNQDKLSLLRQELEASECECQKWEKKELN